MATGDSRRWLLLVEDNEDEERLAIRAVNRADIDCEVVVARDGEEAQKILDEAGTRLPVFTMLDIKLPKISGIEVLQWIRSQDKFDCLPAIVLVGSAGAVDMNAIYRMGANSLVRKELDYEIYMARMVPTLRYWSLVNTVPNRR